MASPSCQSWFFIYPAFCYFIHLGFINQMFLIGCMIVFSLLFGLLLDCSRSQPICVNCLWLSTFLHNYFWLSLASLASHWLGLLSNYVRLCITVLDYQLFKLQAVQAKIYCLIIDCTLTFNHLFWVHLRI